jgi:uncharacterized protein YcnI
MRYEGTKAVLWQKNNLNIRDGIIEIKSSGGNNPLIKY